MTRSLMLSVAWLALAALAAPGTLIAEQVEPPEPGPAVQPEGAALPPAPQAPSEAPPPVEPPAQAAPAESTAAVAAPTASPSEPAPGSEPATAPSRPSTTDESGARRAFAAASGSVTIVDFSFAPATIAVGVGDTVTWRNDGPSRHSATADDGSFDTGLLSKGRSGSAIFDAAGTFGYFCTLHPSMKGTVRVAAQAGGDTGAGAGGSTDGASGAGETGSQTAGSPTAGPQLPRTGADPAWTAITGLGLLLIGALGLRRSRRTAR